MNKVNSIPEEQHIFLFVNNKHMFDADILLRIIYKMEESSELSLTGEEFSTIYGLVRNQYIHITGHDFPVRRINN